MFTVPQFVSFGLLFIFKYKKMLIKKGDAVDNGKVNGEQTHTF